MRSVSIFAILIFVLAGCARGYIELKTDIYYNNGMKSIEKGDWREAVEQFRLSLESSSIAKDPISHKAQALLHYEYGRALGVICNFIESESHLLRTLSLDQEIDGPVYMTYNELAMLNYKQGNYKKVVKYYKRSFYYMDKLVAKKDKSMDRQEYVHHLKTFAKALNKTGNYDRASMLFTRANEIRLSIPHDHKSKKITPYGTKCVARPAVG